MKRVQKYLDLKEVPINCIMEQINGSAAIKIKKHSFTWGVKKEEDIKDKKDKKKKENV